MRLSQLLAMVGEPRVLDSDPLIVDITEDSREIRPEWMFAAVRGSADNGMMYAADAIQRGAAAILAETDGRPTDVPVVVVSRIREILADCAAQLHGIPSRRLAAFGITGTDGKTTTSYLLTGILEAAGLQTGMMTTVETRIGGRSTVSETRLTTPGAPAVQRSLERMVQAGDRCAVIEASSHALAQQRLRNVSLQAAAVTNIAADHIAFHGSRRAYAQAKAHIFDLVTSTRRPNVVLNVDDPESMRMAARLGSRLLTYGRSSAAALQAIDVETSLLETRFAVRWQGVEHRARLAFGGEFNVYNALAAVGLALTHNVPIEVATGALRQTAPPPGRLQSVDEGQLFTVVVDYAHTEQAFASLAQFLHRLTRERAGRLIMVFGAAGDRDRTKRPNLAQIASTWADYFLITNEDPFGEDASRIIAEVAAGADRSTRGVQWEIEPDRRTAIALALARAGARDVVAVTGKGHERSIAMNGEAVEWSDVRAVRESLRESGYPR